jgi:hypothetical protein
MKHHDRDTRSHGLPPQGERRETRRQKAYVDGWADAGGTAAPLSCKVLDISTTGAKIALPPNARLPSTFVLHVGAAAYTATTMWTKQTEIGVRLSARDK